MLQLTALLVNVLLWNVGCNFDVGRLSFESFVAFNTPSIDSVQFDDVNSILETLQDVSTARFVAVIVWLDESAVPKR